MSFDDDCRDVGVMLDCVVCKRRLPDADAGICPWCHADLALFHPTGPPAKPSYTARRRPRTRKNWKSGGTRE